MNLIDKTQITEPERWNIVFSPDAAKWWVKWLAWGRFNHVWAFAYIANIDCWVIYDVHFHGTRIMLLPNCEKNRAELGGMIKDCEIMSMPRRNDYGGFRFGFWCVIAIKHLVGVRCPVVRPDALWRACLRNGGEIIEQLQTANAPADSRTTA